MNNDNIPAKCIYCEYLEFAQYPYRCKDCKEIATKEEEEK